MAGVRGMVATGPGNLELREFQKPRAPTGGALLKISACGICGTDRHVMAGKARGVDFPIIPGHEFIGVLEEVGRGANESMAVVGGPLKEGDRVAVAPSSLPCGRCHFCLNVPHRPQFCTARTIYGFANCTRPPHLLGGFAEYVVVHERSWVFKLPDRISDELAVLVEPGATALRAVERAMNPGEPFTGQGLGVGKSALVIGSGPIGALVVACLRTMGAGMIIATDMYGERLAMAERLGADAVIDARLPLEERLSRANELTSGVGPDVVIEAAGHPKAFEEALAFVRRGGKVIEVGHYTDTGVAELRPYTICQKDVDIHGSWAYPPVIFKDVLSFLTRTDLPLVELVSHRLPLERLQEGLELAGTAAARKVLVVPGER